MQLCSTCCVMVTPQRMDGCTIWLGCLEGDGIRLSCRRACLPDVDRLCHHCPSGPTIWRGAWSRCLLCVSLRLHACRATTRAPHWRPSWNRLRCFSCVHTRENGFRARLCPAASSQQANIGTDGPSCVCVCARCVGCAMCGRLTECSAGGSSCTVVCRSWPIVEGMGMVGVVRVGRGSCVCVRQQRCPPCIGMVSRVRCSTSWRLAASCG